MFEPIGTRIASKITDALAGKVNADYKVIEKIVYDECLSIARNSYSGDWLEMPDGTSFELKFKPTRKV